MPTALLGGFVGLMLSGEVIPGSYEIDVDGHGSDRLSRARASASSRLRSKIPCIGEKRKLWSTGMVITSTYSLQGFIGILLVMLFFTDQFRRRGIALAAGLRSRARAGDELRLDVEPTTLNGHGVALGASYAFLGFLWGGIIGVFAINLILSRKKGRSQAGSLRRGPSRSAKRPIEIDTVQGDQRFGRVDRSNRRDFRSSTRWYG
ncbi:MAG: hypothetical protein MZU97_16360 [Bacillus subtilis]|nr:hypothetical protein [Bacillus subtilis]